MSPIVHTGPADRKQLLDAVRLLAAAGVIIAHVTTELFPHSPLWALGSFSVPFYLFAALYFTVRGFRKDPGRTIPSYLLGRLLKLYLPFLFWNVAYDVMHLVKYPDSPMSSPLSLAWAATYAHLYFLPLLAAATFLVVLFIRPILASSVFRIMLSVLALSGAVYSTWFIHLPEVDADTDPSIQTLYHFVRTLPPTLFAIVFAIWVGTRDRPLRVPPKLGLLGLALMLAALATQVQFSPHPMMRTLSGFGLILIAFTPFYAKSLRPVAALGRYSYGIYLSHVAFIRIALTVTSHFGVPQNELLAIGVGTFAFVCGALLSVVLAQSKWTSWIVGCDVGTSRGAGSDHLVKQIHPAVSPLRTASLQTPNPLENAPR